MLFRTKGQVLDFLDYMDGRGIVFEDNDMVNETLNGFEFADDCDSKEITDKNYMEIINKLYNKWGDLNEGLTTDELKRLKIAFEVGLTDVEKVLWHRKLEMIENQQ